MLPKTDWLLISIFYAEMQWWLHATEAHINSKPKSNFAAAVLDCIQSEQYLLQLWC